MNKVLSAGTAMIITIMLLASASCGEETGTTASTAMTATSTTADAPVIAFDKPMATVDPFDDPSGPFHHQVFKATSPDGLEFTRAEGVVLDKASVPDIIRMPDGRLIIYAVDGGGRSESGMMVAASDDDGETWRQGSLQVEYTGDHIGGADPDAVLLEDGSVRLYYIVFPKDKPPLDQTGMPILEGSEPVRVMSATSSDGVNFVEEDGNRVESSEIITDPDVVKIGEKWFMYLSQGQVNIAYESTDGTDFTLIGPVRSDGAVSNTVPISGGRYRQYFCGQGIMSAVTTDGIAWTNDPGVRISEEPGKVACDPAPVELAGGWIMFYKVGDIPQLNGYPGGSPYIQPPAGGDPNQPVSSPPGG